ncbi:MAG TPA: ABC transporter permease subunit [Candidatus Limnocylindria bacterium]|nr:ABC transporter permease subunit [Candidatus Limnocylindria bacterium]
MEFLASVGAWLAAPARWSGGDGIPNRLIEHVQISALALAVAAAIALPIGLALGHAGRGGFFAVNVAAFGRALPSFAMIALALPVSFALGQGLGSFPTVLAMIPLGLPPIVTNTYVGIRQVDRDVVEAARGMGLGEARILSQVELPLAAPVILAGIRGAAVAIVATATLGALVAGGGLGRYIVDGLALQEYERLFAGALLVALLAIATELALGALERSVSPYRS